MADSDYAVVELNDSEATVVRAGRVAARSPGVAVIGSDRVELGETALRRARLDPRNTFNRFWSNLDQTHFRHATQLARHNADLAFVHMLALHEQAGGADEVIFAVPGSFTKDQLSLLLGMAQAAPFTARGLVDSAVAAVAATGGAGTYNHLDAQLHYAVITTVEVSSDARRTAVKVINDAGLAAIHDRCANHIAELFIQQSRFDPLHHAQTEQALYNGLLRCRQALAQDNETVFEVQYERARYQSRVSRETLVEALAPVYDKIVTALDPTRPGLVHPRLAGLPGFMERLTAAGITAQTLNELAVSVGCLHNVPARDATADGVYFITQLAVAEPAAGAPLPLVEAPVGNAPGAAATHVLSAAQAHPLGTKPLYLSTTGALSRAREPDSRCCVIVRNSAVILGLEDGADTVLINGQPATADAPLKPGDRLHFTDATTEYTLIRALH